MAYVYIAGPYSLGDVVHNTYIAIRAGDKVAKLGHFVFIPHLSHYWHAVCQHEYGFWMDQCIGWLAKCDALIRLPGVSQGADTEVGIAKRLYMPMYYGVDEFVARYGK